MNASLIVIGTELTRGIIQDKHGVLVSKELTSIGIHMNEIVAIPDDGTIKGILKALIDGNDMLIVTGGLGPTSDDMTRYAIAEAAGTGLVRNDDCWSNLLCRLGERAYGANEKQAMIPEGFSVIPNANGTAPGFYGMCRNTLVIALPGPPKEMSPMFYEYVLPLIAGHIGAKDAERDEYSTFVISEARLEELCEKADPGLEWGTRFQDYRISLYVSGADKARRDTAIGKICGYAGQHRVEAGDVSALGLLVEDLKEKNLTVSVSESCTGGLASSLLTSLPGSSAYMLGAVTAYSPDVKEHVLGVSRQTIERYGCVSEECAKEMAEGVLRLMGSDFAFSVTGVAGPDNSEGKDVGTVCFGFSGKDMDTVSVTVHMNSWGRESIRRRSAVIAFILQRAYIHGEDIEKIVSGWNVF